MTAILSQFFYRKTLGSISSFCISSKRESNPTLSYIKELAAFNLNIEHLSKQTKIQNKLEML